MKVVHASLSWRPRDDVLWRFHSFFGAQVKKTEMQDKKDDVREHGRGIYTSMRDKNASRERRIR
jgi:hypothetical protein